MNFDLWPRIPVWSIFRFTEIGQTENIKKAHPSEISKCRIKVAKPQVSTDFSPLTHTNL